MKLKEPIAVREQLMQRGWDTIADIAKHLNTSTNTISRALRGKPVRIVTVRTIANALGTSANEIATVVEEG